jgi:hypothetical protein
MLVSYNLGQSHALRAAMPATQMVVGPDGIARPYLVQAGQTALGQPALTQPYGWSSYTAPGAVVPQAYQPQPLYQPQGAYPVQTQYVTERVVTRPAVRQASTQRVASEATPRRSWQKSALLIGGSAGAGAGVGALMGGKKGALAGAAIGGGAAAIYDQVKRR